MTAIHHDTTAVVIGGGGGVGRGIALGLAAKGARVAIADLDPVTAAAVADELTGLGHEAVAATVDATNRTSLAELADLVEGRFGSTDVLVNCVGVVHSGELVDAPDTDWAWVFEFNLMSIVRACAVFVPRIRAGGRGGHIVNTASMAGLWASSPDQVAGAHLGLYTTSKFAVVGFSEALRGELTVDDIGVSCLCPGTVDSNLIQTSLRHRPERYGGAVDVDATLGRIPFAMAQEDVGRFVVAGIEHDRALIITHPRARHFVDERAASQGDDFDFFATIGDRA